ncbi:DNA polymerase IV [Devriesea agamarum]|uniref:DNA polymerase IV n=1 Tax=Devriesea agamarum TaxID=472569 RepID=UPI0022B2329B|nr:DNA polymerase IV [Devriesea agamarum]
MGAILHVDMDSFFASVEIRDDPALRGRPVVVGGVGPRAVVAAASYPARRYGVRSAMPMGKARRLCPDLVIVPPRIAHYREVSREVMAILHGISAQVQQISIDEAFLDVSGAIRHFGAPPDIATLIRTRIRTELGLPCSVGVAASKSVAKIASARAKPDGMLVVPTAHTPGFLAPLPVEALSGIGSVAAAKLHNLGVRTVGDLRAVPQGTMQRVFGAHAAYISRVAQGQDDTPVTAERVEKSVGTEHTYDTDLTDPVVIRRELTRMADDVASSLRRHRQCARTVSIKVRFGDGHTVTRSSTLPEWTTSGERVRQAATSLWDRLGADGYRVRLLGVRTEHLRTTEGLSLQEELGTRPGWSDLESAMDRARNKYGSAVLSRGSTMAPPQPVKTHDDAHDEQVNR